MTVPVRSDTRQAEAQWDLLGQIIEQRVWPDYKKGSTDYRLWPTRHGGHVDHTVVVPLTEVQALADAGLILLTSEFLPRVPEKGLNAYAAREAVR